MASTDNGSDVSETSASTHKPSQGGDQDEENACTCVVVPVKLSLCFGYDKKCYLYMLF